MNMKSCYVNVDRLIGIVELEAPDDINVGDRVISELDKGNMSRHGAHKPS